MDAAPERQSGVGIQKLCLASGAQCRSMQAKQATMPAMSVMLLMNGSSGCLIAILRLSYMRPS